MTARAGFSLLEAIVALAVIGGGLGAVYVLQAQLVTDLGRAQAAAERAQFEISAVEYVRGINPMETPEGAFALDEDWVVSWRARPLTPEQPLRTAQRNIDARSGRLYAMEITLTGPDGARVGPVVEMTLMGDRLRDGAGGPRRPAGRSERN